MEGNFRNTLIILSAVIIAIIFIHGFITIRKNKNPYKLKSTNEKIDPVKRGFDGSGFDQDGVSKPRVVNDSSDDISVNNLTGHSVDYSGESSADEVKLKAEPILTSFDYTTEVVDTAQEPLVQKSEGTSSHEGVSHDNSSDNVNSKQNLDISLTDSGAEQFTSEPKHFSDEVGDDIADFDYGVIDNPSLFDNEPVVNEVVKTPDILQKPLYDTPITRPKPEAKEVLKVQSTVKKKEIVINKEKSTKKQSTKRNQIELNFGEPLQDNDMPSMSATDNLPTEKQKKLEPLEPEVLVVSIVMPEGQVISGAALLPILLTLGLRYGEMNIFHRHEDSAGNGKVTFSLANMMNPGTFDLDALETFTTRGLTLFMTLPNAGDAFEVFEHMLGAAKQISVEFGAQLLDDKRSVMTKQTEQHFKGKIREFERKNRIALS